MKKEKNGAFIINESPKGGRPPSSFTFPMSNNPLPFSTTTLDNRTPAAKKPHLRPEAELRHQSLLPGLPDHLSHLCLSLVPPSELYAVCRSWRRLIYSPSFPPFLSLYALLLPAGDHHHLSIPLEFASFDPISARWRSLTPPPPDWPLRFLFRHPSFISRKLPIQSVAVDGKLVVLAATNDDFLPALSQPLIFDPLSRRWALGPKLPNPRRWCAAGASRAVVYVASGIGSNYNTDVARSVERWDVNCHRHHHQPPRRRRWTWQKMGNLKDGNAKFHTEITSSVSID